MVNDGRKIGSLREMPRDITPARDLWKGIEARLADQAPGDASRPRAAGRSRSLRFLSAAAVIAALAVGIWIGRDLMPANVAPAGSGSVAGLSFGEPGTVRAAYLMDSRYAQQRQALVQSLEVKLAALPPESRAKVVSSLQTIHDSMRDLEAALGHDPGNALLQELLVNTYQDEMRVLTAVHEAGNTSEGI